jgi:3-dehydroquinate dehydratase-2
MSSARNRVEVMHGVNFDVLERRDPEIYGGQSLTELEVRIKHWARDLGLEARFFQSNAEGEFVEHLHRLPELADAVILNAGAWTHYSRGIADALQLAGLPAVEVHLSDVSSREDWRSVSVFEGMVIAKISGKGADGYHEALEVLVDRLGTARDD